MALTPRPDPDAHPTRNARTANPNPSLHWCDCCPPPPPPYFPLCLSVCLSVCLLWIRCVRRALGWRASENADNGRETAKLYAGNTCCGEAFSGRRNKVGDSIQLFFFVFFVFFAQTRQDRTGQDRTGQGKTRHDTSRPDQTRPDKPGQDMTTHVLLMFLFLVMLPP